VALLERLECASMAQHMVVCSGSTPEIEVSAVQERSPPSRCNQDVGWEPQCRCSGHGLNAADLSEFDLSLSQ
jgi:hypothetical protein